MVFEIKRHKNGVVIKSTDDEEGIVYQEKYDDEIDGFVGFLYEILEYYGPSTSRYSDKRIHIHVTKGDKCDGPRGESVYENCGCVPDNEDDPRIISPDEIAKLNDWGDE